MRNDQTENSCAICGCAAEVIESLDHGNKNRWKCKRCGEFSVVAGARSSIATLTLQEKAKMSGWIFDQNSNSQPPSICRDTVKRVIARSKLSIRERIDRFLLEAVKNQSKLGSTFNFQEPRFIAATHSQDYEEVRCLAQMLVSKQMIGQELVDSGYQILYEGYNVVDTLIRENKQSGMGFVAMSFNDELNQAYQYGIQIGIREAGYEPCRVDGVEHANKIDDKIVTLIKKSDFVVADFTDHKGGVYFEAGFALGLDLPIIWTCREDHMKDLHFDIRQYNTIDWKSPEDLAKRLGSRIENIVGKGPLV